jgi:DNA gyrase subunit B
MDENIVKLNLREHILTRPGMYIGRDWDAGAVHSLLVEICRLAIAPEFSNECSNLKVIIQHDTSISIVDDGRGLPVEAIRIDQSVELPKIEHIFLWLMKSNPLPAYYKDFGFLNYLSVVLNNVSSLLEVETKFDGNWYRLTCARGKIIDHLHKIDMPVSRNKGTRLTFTPDPVIFADFRFNYEEILTGLSELKGEYPTVSLLAEDKRSGTKKSF